MKRNFAKIFSRNAKISHYYFKPYNQEMLDNFQLKKILSSLNNVYLREENLVVCMNIIVGNNYSSFILR